LCYQRAIWAGLAFGLAIGIKLLPLLFLPFVWRKLGFVKFLYFSAGLVFILMLIGLPLINMQVIMHIADSLDLYFRKFEFNASIYYLLRWLGFQVSGYNMIALLGPALSLVTFIVVVWLAVKSKLGSVKRLAGYMAVSLTVYLL